MKKLEDFIVVETRSSQKFFGIVYRNLLDQILVLQRLENTMMLGIISKKDSLNSIFLVFNIPVLKTGQGLMPYVNAGQLSIQVMQDFGYDGLLLWAKNGEKRFATFPVAPQYRDKIMEVLYK